MNRSNMVSKLASLPDCLVRLCAVPPHLLSAECLLTLGETAVVCGIFVVPDGATLTVATQRVRKPAAVQQTSKDMTLPLRAVGVITKARPSTTALHVSNPL